MTAPSRAGGGTQPSLLTDAELEAARPGSTRPWNPAAARDYLTGLSGGTVHAVGRGQARAARQRTRPQGPPLEAVAACGDAVLVPARGGAYDRAAAGERACRVCAWHLAIIAGGTGTEAALLIPGRPEAAALARSGAGPQLASRVCQAILRAARRGEDEDGRDLDSPAIPRLLALAAAHRPVLYVTEARAEGDCETCPRAGGDRAPVPECAYHDATAGCGACTPAGWTVGGGSGKAARWQGS
jgi:hypothetical protein